jgi:pyruvate dehydrogenase E1 component alpha subunit
MARTPAPPAENETTRPPGQSRTVELATDADLATKVIGTMWRIRLFEEAVDELFARGLMHGTMHLSIGQEASSTWVCLAMREGYHLTSIQRGHGNCI